MPGSPFRPELVLARPFTWSTPHHSLACSCASGFCGGPTPPGGRRFPPFSLGLLPSSPSIDSSSSSRSARQWPSSAPSSLRRVPSSSTTRLTSSSTTSTSSSRRWSCGWPSVGAGTTRCAGPGSWHSLARSHCSPQPAQWSWWPQYWPLRPSVRGVIALDDGMFLCSGASSAPPSSSSGWCGCPTFRTDSTLVGVTVAICSIPPTFTDSSFHSRPWVHSSSTGCWPCRRATSPTPTTTSPS